MLSISILSFCPIVSTLLSLDDQVVQILAFLSFFLEFANDGTEILDVLDKTENRYVSVAAHYEKCMTWLIQRC